MQGKLAKEWCIRGRGTLEVGQVNTLANGCSLTGLGWVFTPMALRCRRLI